MNKSKRQRLDDAIARRDAAQSTVQKHQGRLSAAEDRMAEIKAECAERGVPPEKLDRAISQLELRYEKAVTSFENDIKDVEGKLAPYAKEGRA